MLSVYESFHKMAKYGQQRNYILQDLIGLMKTSKTENLFEIGFQQPKSGLQNRY